MASDIWLRTILIVRKETRCPHIGYSYLLTARVLLYAPSHRQDTTYHGLSYTSVETRSMIDYLVRFETFCRKPFIHNQHFFLLFILILFNFFLLFILILFKFFIIIIILFYYLYILFYFVIFLRQLMTQHRSKGLWGPLWLRIKKMPSYFSPFFFFFFFFFKDI